jgi:hypothetical protein
MAASSSAALSIGFAAALQSNNVDFMKSKSLHVVKFLSFIDSSASGQDSSAWKGEKKFVNG